jgi:hypothetical protein
LSAPVVVLGPQRPTPNLRAHLDRVAPEGPVALVTAGWRHDERETGPLLAHVDRPVRHLELYAEMDALLRAAPELAAAYRARQKMILAYKDVYRVSLRAALHAVLDLRRHAPSAPELYGPDLDDAFDALRRIDARLLKRLDTIADQHASVVAPWRDFASVARARDRLAGMLDGVSALLLAGGHVAVLRNRLRFFGLDRDLVALPERGVPIVAWSAGAMVLSRRIVLFYDDPPHGHGEAEVLARGFGLLPGAVFLPHARLRLNLDDVERVALFAGRFFPDACIGLEPGAALELAGGRWTDLGEPDAAFRLGIDGLVLPGGVG